MRPLGLTPGLATPACAQGPGAEQDDAGRLTSGIFVTGSSIRGAPADAALPVDMISFERLMKQGSPTAVETLKALPPDNSFTVTRVTRHDDVLLPGAAHPVLGSL